ncbi:hypothetical protein GMOD_00002451 [Pyrenophora seminiperda CCB06]|uniref:Uncharacterized protein n=1 Tax=Pyrenophora seminiperda CCB06 TaxID=1302712 RepID=A0A3M7M2F1_9PLEO|nr:hypothetical protein GMOD_00002451 [Pyrenophora seminiperda CCB06]
MLSNFILVYYFKRYTLLLRIINSTRTKLLVAIVLTTPILSILYRSLGYIAYLLITRFRVVKYLL